MNQADKEALDKIRRLAGEIISGGHYQRHKIDDLVAASHRFEYMTIHRNGLIRWLKRYDKDKQKAAKNKAWKRITDYVGNLSAACDVAI